VASNDTNLGEKKANVKRKFCVVWLVCILSLPSRQVIYTRSMVTSKRPSAAVIAAGIVAIVGSVLTMLGVLMGLFGVILGRHLAQQSPMPTFVQTTAIAGMAFLLAQTALGIFTGVGLLRLRNWARISALVWAGITVPCALLIVFMMLLVPLPTPSRPEAPTHFLLFFRFFLALFYGIPLGVGIWWLILFTRKGVAAQFAAPVPEGEGLPGEASSEPLSVRPTTAPLPVIVLAWFFLISSLSIGFVVFTHMPAVLFGFAIRGPAGTAIYVIWCLLFAAAGIGLLRVRRWAYSLALGLQIIGLVSGTISLLSPRYEVILRESLFWMDPSMASNASYVVIHARSYAFIGLLAPIVVLVMLLYYRPRFLEASNNLLPR
jgi:hypothetical protein